MIHAFWSLAGAIDEGARSMRRASALWERQYRKQTLAIRAIVGTIT